MEAYVRGFSYMPENKVEVIDLQYIEGGELERTWKVSRRHRVKEQEQRIWEEFVKEQDIVGAALKEDPYQFLHELPDNCLKDLMETELQKMKEEAKQEAEDQPKKGEGDSSPADKTVTFLDDEKGACDIFHIFDDDNENENDNDNDNANNDNDNNNDDNDNVSGPDEEAVHSSACSVRDDCAPYSPPSPDDGPTPLKSNEDVASLVESSIYCARVKDLRVKINEELLAIISSLDIQKLMSEEWEEVVRRGRRAAEFSARFNRVYMYQLQRQLHDIKRCMRLSLPFAQHTQFQAQMLRLVSLHQNMLQAVQVFHKSVQQTWCLTESASCLRGVLTQLRAASAQCAAARAPAALCADELLSTCDKLDEALQEYSDRVSDFLSNADNASTSVTRKSNNSRNKTVKGNRSILSSSKSGSKSNLETDTRLSMYSMDTLHVTIKPKNSSSKDNNQPKTKGQQSNNEPTKAPDKSEKPKKRSPRSRRPLMRAPPARTRTRPPAPRVGDADLVTLVQAVDVCTSSHISRSPSPRRTPRRMRARTPRRPQMAASMRLISPKVKSQRNSPKPSQILKALGNYDDENQEFAIAKLNLSPVLKTRPKKDDAEKVEATKDGKDQFKEQNPGNNNVGQRSSAREVHNNNSARENEASGQDSGRYIGPPIVNGNSGKESAMTKDVQVNVETPKTPRKYDESGRVEKMKVVSIAPAQCEVTRLLRQLCSGDASGSGMRNQRVSGTKNAQLLCINGGSPRQPSTPQLLRILEETIQKKAPKPMYQKTPPVRDPDRYRLTFNISEKTSNQLFQYRTKFVQHMLTSPMYANGVVGKPWEMIGSVSERIIEDMLTSCAKEMQIQEVVEELLQCESN